TVVPEKPASPGPEVELAPPKRQKGPAIGEVSPNDGDAKATRAPAAPTPVGPPARVRTRAGQTRQLALHGGTTVKVAQSTLMTVTPQSDGIDRPALEKGDAAFSVPHQAPGHNFSVMAGPYRIV